MKVNEELQVEEYHYPLAKQINSQIKELILSADGVEKRPAQLHAHMTRRQLGYNYRNLEILQVSKWIENRIRDDFIAPTAHLAAPYESFCSDSWGVVYNKGDSIDPHRHDPAQFSFSYWVNVPEGSSPLVFTNSGVEIEPEEGKVVIFESRLLHHVPPCDCDGRIVLVGNYEKLSTNTPMNTALRRSGAPGMDLPGINIPRFDPNNPNHIPIRLHNEHEL